MRKLAIALLAAAGFAVVAPEVASAADGCGRGRAWNGYRCVWVAPRVYGVPPVVGVYRAPPVVVYRAPRYRVWRAPPREHVRRL